MPLRRVDMEKSSPDVVLMDIGLPEKSGIESVAEMMVEFPGVHVLMLHGVQR